MAVRQVAYGLMTHELPHLPVTARRWHGFRVWVATCGLWAGAVVAVHAQTLEAHFLTTEYPPFSVESAPDGGLFVRAVRQALAKSGWKVSVRSVPWARVLLELPRGGVDGVLICWPDTIRRYRLIPSDTIFESQLGFFVRTEDAASLDARLAYMRGKVVGTVRGYGYPPELAASGVVRQDAADDASNLVRLAKKRIDYAAVEKAVGDYILSRPAMLATRSEVTWKEPAFAILPLTVGFAPGSPHAHRLLQDLNRGMAALRRSGALKVGDEPEPWH